MFHQANSMVQRPNAVCSTSSIDALVFQVVPRAPTPVEENWDPEPEEEEPATISDEAIIDIEGDDDPNDLGLLDPNAPDEMLDDDRSINEAPPDPYGDGEPEQFVGRDWERPEGTARSGHVSLWQGISEFHHEFHVHDTPLQCLVIH